MEPPAISDHLVDDFYAFFGLSSLTATVHLPAWTYVTPKKVDSIEGLAALTQDEFLAVARRFDTLEQKADHLEEKVDTGFKAIADILDLVRADVHDIKIALGPLVRTVASLEETVGELDKRVVRLEEKAGVAK